MKNVEIAVIAYPTASKSAIYGFAETIELANGICSELEIQVQFATQIKTLESLDGQQPVDAVVLPPCSNDSFYNQKSEELYQYLNIMQQQGALLASACVGAFVLARGGFLDNKFCTTHWRLAAEFKQSFPKAKLNENAIIVNEGNVITAGGRMAWLDLAFEVISRFCSPVVVARLSKEMVTDTGYREQRFYSQFVPRLDHGDELVKKVQVFLAEHFAEPISIETVAQQHYVSIRTLQRRFQKAMNLNLIEYLQKLRLTKACQLIELSGKSINEIAWQVGYQNVNAFRKVFVREYGLSPVEFRRRFSKGQRNQ